MARSKSRKFSINYPKIFGTEIRSRPMKIKLLKLKKLKLLKQRLR